MSLFFFVVEVWELTLALFTFYSVFSLTEDIVRGDGQKMTKPE